MIPPRSHRLRCRAVITVAVLCALAAAAILAPAARADGAAPPALVTPTNGTSISTDASNTYEWTGSLQGDATALDRSYMEVEIAPAALVPAGQNTPWSAAVITQSFQTVPGDATTHRLPLGSPPAGSYDWRVCAFGVASVTDATANNAIALITCSPARTLTVTAASDADQAPAVVTMQHTHVTAAPKTRYRTVYRDAPAASPKTPKAPKVIYRTRAVAPAAHFVNTPSIPVVDFARTPKRDTRDVIVASGSASRLGDGVASSLSWSIPGLPVPFWTLLLLGAAFPIAIWWRRMLAAMFEPNTTEAP